MGFGTRGPLIAYTIAQTDLGPALIGATADGVCAVHFGEPALMLGELARAYPGAEYVRDDRAMAGVASAVASAISGEDAPELLLAPAGTEFQKRVWEALTAIPRGQTATYAQVAEAIGAPKAARAVAGACAANHIAVLIPCHRVVRADGALGGYKWGVDRKRALLEGEGVRVR